MTINCKTSDQRASSSSLWLKKDTNPAKEIVPNGGAITRRGNRFYFSGVALNNAGPYRCQATLPIINKTIEKEVTTLLVFTGKEQTQFVWVVLCHPSSLKYKKVKNVKK